MTGPAKFAARSGCSHPRVQMVWTKVGNTGDPLPGQQLRSQCLDCGQLSTEQHRHALATPNTRVVNLELLNRGIEAREQYWREQSERYRRNRESEKQEWWAWYSTYLQSDEWRIRRALVLRRANDICEGCRDAPATQVHHLTYAHVGNEFLWELVAICDDCHERYHEIDAA
jgi:hypothetical protein